MNARKRARLIFVLAAAFLVSAAFLIGSANAQVAAGSTIHIRSDGSIDPSSVPIQRSGNTYVFTGDVFTEGISVEKEGIVIDGAGHTLMGPYDGAQTLWVIGEGPNQPRTNETFWMGINIVTPSVGGLTIKNLNLKNFSIGIWLWSANNMVVGNAITECIIGVLLEGSTNTITENYIANNKNGVYFGETQAGNISANVNLLENCFVNNLRQLSGCVCIDYNTTEPIHTWDNGTRGNYWSDYNGTDSNGDGIGDVPYVIDVLNQDRYPLMQSTVTPPTPAPKTPVEIIISAVAVSVVAVGAAAIVFTRKRKNRNPGR